jgi:preprotein translocase subunit YajC
MIQQLLVWAQGGGGQGGQEGAWHFPLLLLALFFLFWMFILRPMSRRQEQERAALLAMLNKNDKVLTHSGIYGTIISVAEKEDEIVIKVDDNVRLRMTKGSIARNLTREEAARAAKEAKKEGAA